MVCDKDYSAIEENHVLNLPDTIIPRFSKAAEHAAAVVGGLRFPEFGYDQ